MKHLCLTVPLTIWFGCSCALCQTVVVPALVNPVIGLKAPALGPATPTLNLPTNTTRPLFKWRFGQPLVMMLQTNSRTAKATMPLKPGIYETAPYSCLVNVPGAQEDEKALIAPRGAAPPMPVVKPELQFTPWSPGK
jgi:hypothetical protein